MIEYKGCTFVEVFFVGKSTFVKVFFVYLHLNRKMTVMEYVDIQPLLNAYHRKVASTSLRFKRYLYRQISWDVRLANKKGVSSDTPFLFY